MKVQTVIPLVDTNIIPARNAGIASLLWDLQNPRGSDRDEPPLLNPAFAFIDVGVSRAKVSTTLKTLLAKDFRMEVDYVATELLEVVPYANVTLLGARAEKIRGYLSGMISFRDIKREVTDWHYVVDGKGKVSSVAYSYNLQGNEVWEAYFMGRAFMVSGENVAFSDPVLDELLAPDVAQVESMIDLQWKRDKTPGQPELSNDWYKIEKHPLEAGLAEFGITLQKTDVPQRIEGKQNVLYLGNILNHYPQGAQASELNRIGANMQEGDIIIVQVDEIEKSFIEVLCVKGWSDPKTRERVRWIDTRKLEVHKPVRGRGSWQKIYLKPQLEQIVSRLFDCLGRKVVSTVWSQKNYRVLVQQHINPVFGTFFRALPVEQTLRIAIREALRKLPPEEILKGIPVFKDDTQDANGGTLGLDTSPVVSEEDFLYMKMLPVNIERIPDENILPLKNEIQ